MKRTLRLWLIISGSFAFSKALASLLTMGVQNESPAYVLVHSGLFPSVASIVTQSAELLAAVFLLVLAIFYQKRLVVLGQAACCILVVANIGELILLAVSPLAMSVLAQISFAVFDLLAIVVWILTMRVLAKRQFPEGNPS